MKANINSITRLRINEDGGGVRSVIFMCGCPLECLWCCNPEVQKPHKYKTLDIDELYDYISNDVPYFKYSGGGVTFSGGEPLLNSLYIKNFIEKYCKGFDADIETSLYTDLSNIKMLCPLIGEWYIDFKVFDEQKHIECTGVSNKPIKRNLEFLAKKAGNGKIIITYPLITGYNTSDENLAAMMAYLKKLGLNRIDLHPYRKMQEEKHRQIGLEPTVIPELSFDLYKHIKHTLTENGFELIQRDIYREKDKCTYLKSIRKKICREKNIALDIKDCDFKDRCVGTCPQCEYELGIINEHLK